MPEPRLVAALGDCAIGCNVLGSRTDLAGPLDSLVPVDLRIPGCPPTPAAIAEALVGALRTQRGRDSGSMAASRSETSASQAR
jgi:Ni,Fe-hydrogenase III small subunit